MLPTATNIIALNRKGETHIKITGFYISLRLIAIASKRYRFMNLGLQQVSQRLRVFLSSSRIQDIKMPSLQLLNQFLFR